MSVVQERCPACSAPLPIIQPNVRRLQCSYCGSGLSIERQGNSIAVELAEKMLGTIEQSGVQTQAEFRRLRLTQELSSAEMRLAHIQSEIRSIERGPLNGVSRSHLNELRAQAVELQQRIAQIQGELYPEAGQAIPEASKPSSRRGFSPGHIRWLLFSMRGRATRTDFWRGAFVLFGLYIIFSITTAILQAIPEDAGGLASIGTAIFSLAAFVQMVFLIWIGVAVSVKRFHDHNKTGWWVLVGLIPLVGLVWLLVELGLLPGSPGMNRYG